MSTQTTPRGMANPMIFINLPVSNLQAAVTFYTSLGFHQNLKYTSDTATMVSIGPAHAPYAHTPNPASTINVMLLVRPFFQTFLAEGVKIADPKDATGVMLCLSCHEKEGVDEMVGKAGKAGAEVDVVNFPQMEGMYGRSFRDLDGHDWEVMWMSEDVAMSEKGPGQ